MNTAKELVEVERVQTGLRMEKRLLKVLKALAELKDQDRIVFRYSTPAGEITREANPNGSLENIAGICSPGGNVVGMMPHPERSAELELGCIDGLKVFQSLVGAMATR